MTVRIHELAATRETVHWGYFDCALEPVLSVSSGISCGSRRSPTTLATLPTC